ncbi:hypothetical protein KY289_030785 [Solanum tuberosum]|nr:hypothetical protein KY289_030785 [Solanum tuberosum]
MASHISTTLDQSTASTDLISQSNYQMQCVWKNEVRANHNECGIVERDEFERCIEITMGYGEEGEELRKNVKK